MIALIAPALFAFFQNIPSKKIQKNALSSPPKANILIFQITLGGLMEIPKIISPITKVQIWLSIVVVFSDTACPFFSFSCIYTSFTMEDVVLSSRDEIVEMDAAIGPMIQIPATNGFKEPAIASGMILSTLFP